MSRFEHARAILIGATSAGAFPGAGVQVGSRDAVIWQDAIGALTYDADAAPVAADTVYDLASLTKVVATTTLAMRLVDGGRLRLDDRVTTWIPDWRGTDRESVTIRDLLGHASGLTRHLPLFRDHATPREFENAICSLPLEYPPRTRSIYSDLGFILLGFIIERAGGARLADQFTSLVADLNLGDVGFNPPRAWRARAAPTEISEWRGRLLVGEVHDDNAWTLGGAPGHTGLFGAVGALGRFARVMLGATAGDARLADPATISTFIRRTDVPGSSRALGWDTMLPTSSCGRRLSPSAIGHTGFTGTSLWIDPAVPIYVVLLTNRVHPRATNDAILTVRPALHDAIIDGLHLEA